MTGGKTVVYTSGTFDMLHINHLWLKEIDVAGGVAVEDKPQGEFRNRIKNLLLEIVSKSLSNAVTPLHPTNGMSADIFLELKDAHGIWIY